MITHGSCCTKTNHIIFTKMKNISHENDFVERVRPSVSTIVVLTRHFHLKQNR